MTTPLEEHLGYLSDSVRLERYRMAIREAVKPGDRVLDLGCGTGVLGLMALQVGAGQVIALDSAQVVEVARESLTRAGWENRISALRGHSTQLELPERVDVVLCDQIGYFGLDYGILHTLQDARHRLLKPGGALVPSRLDLYIAAVESEPCLALLDGWARNPVPKELHWLREWAVNSKHTVRVPAEALLGPAVQLASLSLREDQPDFLRLPGRLEITRPGCMHGLVGWFDSELFQGVRMTNSPLRGDAIRRPQVFLPLRTPIEVVAGESLEVTVMARPSDQLLAWEVRHDASGAYFRHSTWEGEVLLREDLGRLSPEFIPRLNREGDARLKVLQACDGQRSTREIEEFILREYPGLFPTPGGTSRFIARTLGRNAQS